MVTQNKTWRFSKRIKNYNYNVWRKSTSQHFDLGVVISSLLKTPPPPVPDITAPKCCDKQCLAAINSTAKDMCFSVESVAQ